MHNIDPGIDVSKLRSMSNKELNNFMEEYNNEDTGFAENIDRIFRQWAAEMDEEERSK